jgi:hypothetical protein
MSSPTTASSMPSRITMPTSWRRDAPSASRTPNSRVRPATDAAMTP